MTEPEDYHGNLGRFLTQGAISDAALEYEDSGSMRHALYAALPHIVPLVQAAEVDAWSKQLTKYWEAIGRAKALLDQWDDGGREFHILLSTREIRKALEVEQ